jgi:hypothetical protein
LDTDVTATTTRTIASGNQVRCALLLSFTNGETVDVTYRIKGLQLEQAASRTAYQANFSQFHITEADQRPCEYLAPDALDDSMTFATAFAPEGAYTLIAAVDAVSPTIGTIFGSSVTADRQVSIFPTEGQLRANGASNRRRWMGLSSVSRAVHVFRVPDGANEKYYRNGVDMGAASVIAGDVFPFGAGGLNRLFNAGTDRCAQRFFGGALIPRALTDAERVLTENVMKYKMGL